MQPSLRILKVWPRSLLMTSCLNQCSKMCLRLVKSGRQVHLLVKKNMVRRMSWITIIRRNMIQSRISLIEDQNYSICTEIRIKSKIKRCTYMISSHLINNCRQPIKKRSFKTKEEMIF